MLNYQLNYGLRSNLSLNQAFLPAKGMDLTMNKTPRILVMGSINMDLMLGMDRVPAAGESKLINNYNYVPGGKGGNQAAAAAKLGASVTMCGKLGNDLHGENLRESLNSLGVNTEFVGISELASGLATVLVEADGQNRICVFNGANNDLTIADAEKVIAENDFDALLVQFESPTETIIRACELAAEKGMKIIVDAGPAKPFPIEKLKGVTIFSPNETETLVHCSILPDSEESRLQAAKMLKQKTEAEYIILKLGSSGAMIYDGTNATTVKPYKVKAIDTTAAGDAFTAGLTIKYLEHGNLEEAVRYGNAVGALTVTKPGAQTSLPTAEEVSEFLKTAQLI